MWTVPFLTSIVDQRGVLRAVSRCAIRSRGVPARSAEPVARVAMRIMNPFVHLVARMPARVQSKLLAAFLAIVMLLIIVGAVGLQVLSGVNERTEELIKLQRKIEA